MGPLQGVIVGLGFLSLGLLLAAVVHYGAACRLRAGCCDAIALWRAHASKHPSGDYGQCADDLEQVLTNN